VDEVSSPTFVLVNVYRRPMALSSIIWMLTACKTRWRLKIWTLMKCCAAVPYWWNGRTHQTALPKDHLEVQLAWVSDEQRSMAFFRMENDMKLWPAN
jgi:tRNA A37 threonylcarbamoyladenosine biosynthesis protein TsaE